MISTILTTFESYGHLTMEDEEDKTVIQTERDKKRLRKELLGEEYDGDTEFNTDFDITLTD